MNDEVELAIHGGRDEDEQILDDLWVGRFALTELPGAVVDGEDSHDSGKLETAEVSNAAMIMNTDQYDTSSPHEYGIVVEAGERQ